MHFKVSHVFIEMVCILVVCYIDLKENIVFQQILDRMQMDERVKPRGGQRFQSSQCCSMQKLREIQKKLANKGWLFECISSTHIRGYVSVIFLSITSIYVLSH